MQSNKLSVCYYPTTILLLDDKKSFLDELQLSLSRLAVSKTYTQPKKLLEYLEKHYKADPFINRCITYDEESSLTSTASQTDIRAIHKEIYNPDRFKQISVLVVDYAMPNINGLECCELIKDKLIGKILLTGEADNDLAVKAFNRGIIDKFVQKSHPQLKAVINEAVRELQQQYFLDLTEKLAGAISEQVATCLNDPAFVQFFNQLCQKEQIVEYYLTDNYGTFLLLDLQGKPKWLLVKSAYDMEDFFQLADLADAPKSILTVLQKKQKIPYFHTDDDLQVPPAQWAEFMHPAQHLSGKIDYYYAYVTDSAAYQLDWKKITSYQQYAAKVNF